MPIIVGSSGGSGGSTPAAVSWRVEVDANPDATGLFVLDTSALDGPDVLAPDTRWVDTGQVVRKINIRRGRNDESRPYDAAESVVEFDNRSGDFDSDNPYGRYVMFGRKLLGVGTGLRVKASTGSAVSYDSLVEADGAVNYWKCQEVSGLTLADSIGSIPLTLAGSGTSFSASPIASGLGASVDFAGTSAATAASVASTLDAPFTVEAWVATSAPGEIFGTRTPNTFGFDMAVTGAGTGLHGDIGTGAGFLSVTADVTTAIPAAAHIVYVVTTTGYTIYLNGTSVGSGALGGTARLYDATHRPVIGQNGQLGDPYFVGRISNVAAYPTALTGTQVANHYAEGIAVPDSDSTVFTGRVETPAVTDDPVLPLATYTSVDLMAALANIQVPMQGAATGTGETSEDRAEWLLDQAAIPTSLRSVATSGRQLLGTTGEGSVRDALQKVANGEAGRFYVDRNGVVTLTWHDIEFARSSVALFSDDGTALGYMALDFSPGATGVTNMVNVKRTGPRVRNEETGEFESSVEIPDVIAADDESVAIFGRRQEDIDCVLFNDADALSLATYRATRRSQPTQRLTRLTPQPLEALSATDAQTILNLDIGSLITVVRHTVDGRALTFVVTVEGINIDAVPGVTRVSLFTAPTDTAAIYGGTGWFVLDTSALDGPDLLSPF